MQLPSRRRTMEKIWTLFMPKPRTFVSAPPNGWISRERLLVETGIGERRLADWGPRLGLRTCLVSHGRGGMESYYPPDSIRTVKHFLELSANTPRDTDERLWRLWLEEENVDIIAWAKKHLDSGLIELGRGRSDSVRALAKSSSEANASGGAGSLFTSRSRRPGRSRLRDESVPR